MTQPITDAQLKTLMDLLLELSYNLTRKITYGQSLEAKLGCLHDVEVTQMINAQAHIREAAVAIGRIILNRVGDE